MNRRGFLKLFVGTVAVATVPIPNFLLPKREEPKPFFGVDTAYPGSMVMGATLTQEMIEDAAMKSAENMGRPDMIIMEEVDFHRVMKYFGYQVVYE
jgi:hypothetical protein